MFTFHDGIAAWKLAVNCEIIVDGSSSSSPRSLMVFGRDVTVFVEGKDLVAVRWVSCEAVFHAFNKN